MPRVQPGPFAAALFVVSTLAGNLDADEFVPEHGKINTGDATPVGADVVEVEMGYAPARVVRHGWGTFEGSPAASEHMFELSVTWGPTDDLDFGAASGYGFLYEAISPDDPAKAGHTHGHGHADDSLGARYRFLSTGSFDLAVTTGFTLPTGADPAPNQLGLSQVYYSWGSAVVASADAGHATGNLELGFSLPMGPERGQDRGAVAVNAAGGYHVADWLQPEFELNYERALAVGPDPELLALTLGVVAPWGDGNRITAGAQQAIWGRNTSAFTAASVAYKAAF